MGLFEHGESMKMVICGTVSIVMLFLALVCGSIQYLSLVVSDANQESQDLDSDYSATNGWLKVNIFWMATQLVCWLIGTIFMLMFVVWSSAIKMPNMAMSRFISIIGFLLVFLPLVLMAIVIFILSWYAGKREYAFCKRPSKGGLFCAACRPEMTDEEIASQKHWTQKRLEREQKKKSRGHRMHVQEHPNGAPNDNAQDGTVTGAGAGNQDI